MKQKFTQNVGQEKLVQWFFAWELGHSEHPHSRLVSVKRGVRVEVGAGDAVGVEVEAGSGRGRGRVEVGDYLFF